MKYKIINRYTVEDILNVNYPTIEVLNKTHPFYEIYDDATSLSTGEVLEEEIVTDLMATYLFPRILDHIIAESEGEASVHLKEWVSFILKLGVYLKGSFGRYKLMLDSYQTKKDELLAPLKVKGKGRNWFNDTPQSENLDSASEDLSHLTTFGKNDSETETDPTTMMARLNEIEQGYTDLMLAWSDEIIKRFHLEASK